jgi:hypothetical protein
MVAHVWVDHRPIMPPAGRMHNKLTKPKKALNRYLKPFLERFLPIEERRTLLIEAKMNFFLTVQHRYQQNPLQPEFFKWWPIRYPRIKTLLMCQVRV